MSAAVEISKGVLCRACLKRCSKTDISSCQSNGQLPNMFQFCIAKNEENSLPFIICHYCQEKLICFNTFKKQCIESDIFYKRFIKYANKTSISHNEMKKCVDYSVAEYTNDDQNNGAIEKNILKSSKETILSNIENEERHFESTSKYSQIEQDISVSQSDMLSDAGNESPTPYINIVKTNDSTNDTSKKYEIHDSHKNISNNTLRDDLSDLFSGNTYGKDVEPLIISAASGRYNCGKCDRWYKHKIYYEAHVKSHETGVFVLECDICFRQFDKAESFRLHKIAHSGIKKYFCKMCGKGFVFKHRLTVHEKTHLQAERLPCHMCHKTFKTQIFLSNHMVVHSEDRPFACDKCKKSFKTRLRLNEHIKRCFGVKSHMCTLCGKCFFASNDLKIHIRSHSGEKPLECQYCSKRFLCHGHLTVHKRSHTGERPYACHICPKKFSIKRILDNHLLIHSGDQPYSCSVCLRPFRQRSALRTHLKTHNIILRNLKREQNV